MRDLQTTGGTTLNRATWLFVSVAAVILALDVITKIAVVETLSDRPPVKLLGGLVYLVHTRNTGAAFSMASGYTVLLSLVAVGVSIFILRIARKLTSLLWAVSLGLILGGAVGNLIDRLFRHPAPLRGAVVDFLSLLDPVNPPWPVFNVADSALVIGVAIAILLELRGVPISGPARRPESDQEITR
jgi:signal peptidase II